MNTSKPLSKLLALMLTTALLLAAAPLAAFAEGAPGSGGGTATPGVTQQPVGGPAATPGSTNVGINPTALGVGNTFTDATSSLQFKVLTEDGTTGTVAVYDGPIKAIGALTIPSTATDPANLGITYTVTEILANAFTNNANLTSVTIPDSVTAISDNAFNSCTSLTSVTISDGVTTIGANAFQNCGLTSVTIPGSVTTMGNNIFVHCGSLQSAIILDGVTAIGNGAFQNCGLTSVTIPNSVTAIGDNAFQNCRLTSVAIPDSVTTIGSGAFQNCSLLTSVTIPGSVTTISGYAFSGCTGLKSVTIQDGVKSIGNGAFNGCTGLTNVTIPDGVTTIGASAFNGCADLKSVTIPNSVTAIGGSAFSGCANLASVTIPGGVTSINNSVFADCTSLTSVTIPGRVTIIGDDAFVNCGLTSLTFLGRTPPDIGNSAFNGVVGPVKVLVPPGTLAAYQAELNGKLNAVFEEYSITSVTVSPATATVAIGGTQQFTATVTGTNLPAQAVTSVIWCFAEEDGSGSPAVGYPNTDSYTGTSINATGLLTVGANEQPGTIEICAISTVDPSIYESAQVFIQDSQTPQPQQPNGGSGGSSGRKFNTNTTPRNNTPSNVNSTQAADAAKAAAKAAKVSGKGSASVRMKNVGNVPLAALGAMANAAGMPVKFQADSMSADGLTTEVRITLDPSKSTKDLNLSASTTNDNAKAAKTRFEKWYKNKAQVISLGQQGSFGQPVEIAAKVDLSGMDTKNLYIYSYDKETNSYKRIETEYWIDKNGYIHFTTELAGDIIISEGPLERK